MFGNTFDTKYHKCYSFDWRQYVRSACQVVLPSSYGNILSLLLRKMKRIMKYALAKLSKELRGGQFIMRPKTSRPLTIAVEGNIGSGKTTFLKHFSKSTNVHLFSEPVEMWRDVDGHNLLSLMYKDPARWSMTFQSYVQLTMVDLHTRKTKAPIKMMERSIYSARYCFVENLYRNKMLSSPEFSVLDEWFKWITTNLDVGVDTIVYLRTDPEVVYERIKARARKEENCIPLEYLKKLHEHHEDWLYNKTAFSTPAEVIVLDANVDICDMEKVYQNCEYTIQKKISQSPTKSMEMSIEPVSSAVVHNGSSTQ